MARPRYTLAQRLRDPNKRKTIPTNQLPAKYRAARLARLRRERLDRDPLLQPTTILSGAALDQAARAITDAQTAPQISALERQRRNVGTQGTAAIEQTGGLYREMAARELENIARQRALGERARANVGAIAAQNVSTVDARGAQAQQALVAPPGLEGSASERLAAERQALTGRAAAQGAGWQAAAELMGQNYEGLAQAQASARQARGGEMIERLATRMANQQSEIGAKLADEQARKGGILADNLQRMRQQQFENQAILSTNDIKAADLAQDAINARAQRRVQRRGQTLTAEQRAADRVARAEQAALNRENQRAMNQARVDAQRARATVKKQKNESAQSLKYRQNIEGGRAMWRSLMRRYGGDEAKVKRTMIEHPNYRVPPAAYNAIYDLERKGTLHPANVEALKALGVRVPPQWRRRSRRNSPSERPPGGT